MGRPLFVIGFAAGDIPKCRSIWRFSKVRYSRGVLGRVARAQSEKNPRQSGEAGEMDRGGQDLLDVDRTFPLAQTADALKVLAGRKAMGKVILHP